MALSSTSSWRSRRVAPRSRRLTGGALICSLALLALPLCGPAAAAPSPAAGRDAFGMLGRTVLAAIVSSTHADAAINAAGDSLALQEARKRIDAKAEAKARAAAAAPQTEAAVAADPSSLPPASAGSNGSISPHAAAGGEMFAHSRAATSQDGSAILLSGIALAPPDAPEAVKGAINNANTIVGRPYVWGGGHASFYSNGYDCSGSVSFALFGGSLIPQPLTSGDLEHWGAPGPGRWITVYASPTHTFAEIAGLRWDTVGDAQGTGPRWHLAPASAAGFVIRHPPGY